MPGQGEREERNQGTRTLPQHGDAHIMAFIPPQLPPFPVVSLSSSSPLVYHSTHSILR